MPRQIITIELAGLTAGDYVAHLRDPEPSALGHALRAVTVCAEPLGDIVQALLVWEGPAPAPRAAAIAAGLPLVAEVVRVDAVDAGELPAPLPAPARERVEAPKPGRLAALVERAAARLAAQPRPATTRPLVVRWA